MIDTIMRSQAAMTTLPYINEAKEGLLTEWLNQMLFPQNPFEQEPTVRLSADLRLEQATTWVGNANALLKDRLHDFYKDSGFKDIERKLLAKITKDVPEGTLQAWLQLGDNDAQETGWVLDGVFALKQALAFVPKGTVKDTLVKWYQEYDADACVRLGRSVAGNRYTILHTELFGDNVEEDIELYIDLNEALNLSPIPDPLLGLIMEEEPEYIELSFWIGSQGVLQMGLSIPYPSPALVQRLSLVYNEEGNDDLAGFEGALGTERPESLLISRRAEGIVVEVHYD